jgi:hypothetical protein
MDESCQTPPLVIEDESVKELFAVVGGMEVDAELSCLWDSMFSEGEEVESEKEMDETDVWKSVWGESQRKGRKGKCRRCRGDEDWTGEKWDAKVCMLRKLWDNTLSRKGAWRVKSGKVKRSHLTGKVRAALMILIFDEKKKCVVCAKCFTLLTNRGRICLRLLKQKIRSLSDWERSVSALDDVYLRPGHLGKPGTNFLQNSEFLYQTIQKFCYSGHLYFSPASKCICFCSDVNSWALRQ